MKYIPILCPDFVGGTPSDPQSWNRYAYCRGNPIVFIDITGLYKLIFKGNWVDREIEIVESTIKNIEKRAKKVIKNIKEELKKLKKHHNKYSPLIKKLKVILSLFEGMKNDIESSDIELIVKKENSKADAYIPMYSWLGLGNPKLIINESDFFAKEEISREITIQHELLHLQGATHGYSKFKTFWEPDEIGPMWWINAYNLDSFGGPKWLGIQHFGPYMYEKRLLEMKYEKEN